MEKHISFSLVVLSLSITSFGQRAELYLITTSGGFLKTDEINISWSLGEVLTETFSLNDIFLTQGFQQSDDFSNAIKTLKKESLTFHLYPNPASTYFIIESPKSEYSGNRHKIEIFDTYGKIIITKTINQQLNNINIQNWLSGIYFIKLTNVDSKETETIVFTKN